MRYSGRKGRFDREEVNPMNYISNLSDVMLVLAVGILLALIVHWNVDISTSGGSMSDSGQSYAAEGEGGSIVDKDDALSFSQEELDQMEQQETVGDSGGMEKLGEVYYDAQSGNYYIVQEDTKEAAP